MSYQSSSIVGTSKKRVFSNCLACKTACEYYRRVQQSERFDRIYGQRQNPYYIYVPRWIDSSAGIKALHYLCHSLNRTGQIAYLVLCEPVFDKKPRVSPHLLTPILTQEIADCHFKEGLTPIVIYSETIPGNPIGGPFVVRYLLNFIGVLDGPKAFSDEDYLLSYTQMIAEHTKEMMGVDVDQVLFLPPIDPRDFSFNSNKEDFQLVYAGKYRSFVGIPRKVGNLKSIEIYRDGPKMQNRDTVKKLLSRASIVFIFENSSIATEAILSGTPVCFIKTPLSEKIIAEYELGKFGVAVDESEISIEEARSSIPRAIENYLNQIQEFNNNLDKFVSDTQFLAGSVGYQHVVNVPIFDTFVTPHRIALATQIVRKRGLRALCRVTYHFVMRRLSWRFWNNTSSK